MQRRAGAGRGKAAADTVTHGLEHQAGHDRRAVGMWVPLCADAQRAPDRQKLHQCQPSTSDAGQQ